MGLRWLSDVRVDDGASVGGKGASLGELTAAGLPVPPGFVVTAETFRSFLQAAGVEAALDDAVSVDADDPSELAGAAERAQTLIREADTPEGFESELLGAYDELGASLEDDPFVAVRSSATAEDQPDASFAGQQETFLNVDRDGLLESVRECWASLFTQRAIYYRQEQGYPASDVDIAVVVQLMVDADASGVMFTSHPSTGDGRMILEAAWGLGEAVVAGEVSPDNYVLDREQGTVADVSVADKRIQYVRDPETGETIEEPVADADRERRVLDAEALERLREIGESVEDHYGTPQDVEWAIVEHEDGEMPVSGVDAEAGLDGATVYLLQSRPITTLPDDVGTVESPSEEASPAASDSGSAGSSGVNHAGMAGGNQSGTDAGTDGTPQTSAADGGSQTLASAELLVTGLGASPGAAAGPARIVDKLDELDKVETGDVIVTEMTTPDMVPAMQRAAGIVTDEGGMTSHASIISRELGVPAVVGTGAATTEIGDGQSIAIDGETGRVTAGEIDDLDAGTATEGGGGESGGNEVGAGGSTAAGAGSQATDRVPPATATEVKVNVSIPEAAERAAATGADGVGLLRIEHVVLSTGQTPEHLIAEEGEDAFVDVVADGIQPVAEAFYPRPVRVRTLDAPTDEFRTLEGGGDEPEEHNPMLGYRGIRRSLDRPDPFRAELAAVAKCHDLGYDNVELMLPLVTDAEDVRAAKEQMKAVGLDPRHTEWGVMVETPASALCVEGICEEGVDFVSFGTNDLTQYTLAVDRNNERVADRFDELHPAVLELIGDVIETCRAHDVRTSICGQAGSKPAMVRHLVDAGISSISANVDAVADVQREVERVEQRLLLESVREDRAE
ncbi:phosphoenolpyruvate synthase [Salinarchaeum laminariae]|uniref:phosphoenolpyruvate synthase n=1 Tax=Salinarchaeum laminariae TaxID=869888 RepID=UPI0020BF2DF2|nr:phosphoenolpyruvate synthase [Salinarchaeum laminariae]